MQNRTQMLRIALTLNALFSLFCAPLFIIPATQVALFTGNQPSSHLTATGIGLVPFAIFVFVLGRQARPNPRTARIIASVDWVWVALTPLVLSLATGFFSMLGMILMAVIAVFVGCFAYFQWKGARLIETTG